MDNSKQAFSPITYDIWMRAEKRSEEYWDRPMVEIYQGMVDKGIWVKKELSPERIKEIENLGVVFPD